MVVINARNHEKIAKVCELSVLDDKTISMMLELMPEGIFRKLNPLDIAELLEIFYHQEQYGKESTNLI